MKIEVKKKNVKKLEDGMYEITIGREDAEWIAREYLLDIIREDIKEQLEIKGIHEEDVEESQIDEMALDVYDMVRYQSGEDRETVSIDLAIENYF